MVSKGSAETTDDGATITRRLLLAKQLYVHALSHAQSSAALDKMIAVHNFHNAIEVVLRTIMLAYEIRPEREMNITFEAMLQAIDDAPAFREKSLRLPYRTELRKLNTTRNLVQHHAHEPEKATMEEWHVFSRGFLRKSLERYFKIQFETLSSIALIEDERLRRVLELHHKATTHTDWKASVCASKLAFEYASISLRQNLPSGRSSWSFFARTRANTSEMKDLVDKIDKRFTESEHYVVLLTSGVKSGDYARFSRLRIFVHIMAAQNPHFESSMRQEEIERDEAEWVHEFVVQTIIGWQNAGLQPGVPEHLSDGCDKYLDDEEAQYEDLNR